MRQGGLQVYTTIDPQLQEVGLEAMRSALPYSTDPSSALVSIDPRNGEIKAMVSSSSYDHSQFNLAAQGHRQPGSTFKTFVLTTAIKQGIDPYTTYYMSKPLDLNLPKWGHWEVHTADEGYLGTVNLQQATVASDNTVFAQLDLDVGPERSPRRRSRWGSPARSTGSRPRASAACGSASRRWRWPTPTRRSPPAGSTTTRSRSSASSSPAASVDRPQRPQPRRVISEAVAYEVTRLLHDNITEGTGTAAYTGCAGQAGKTGTTDSHTDAWFAGYQPNLPTVVWVGYPQSNEIEMTNVHGITVFGGTFPAEIWHSLYSERRNPLRGIQQAASSRSAGRRSSATSPPRRRAATGASGPGGAAEARRDARKIGEEVIGGYNPERLRTGGRPGTVRPRPAALPRPHRRAVVALGGAARTDEAGGGSS